MPPIEINGEAAYKIGEIKGHYIHNGEVQYLMSFAACDGSEDMWLTEL